MLVIRDSFTNPSFVHLMRHVLTILLIVMRISSNNLNTQVLRPLRLVNTIRPRSNIIVQLDIILKLGNWFDLHELMANGGRLPALEEFWLEDHILVVLVQQADELREQVMH